MQGIVLLDEGLKDRNYQTTKNIKLIQDQLKTAQDWRKSYAYVNRREMDFQESYLVFLKVLPMKRVMRFGKNEKLNPCYLRPFKILEKIEPVVYGLVLTL